MNPSSPTRMRRAGNWSADGFTLVEVVAAFLLFFLGITAAALFLTNVLRTTALTEHATVAIGLAQQKLEQLSSTRRSDLAGGVDSPNGFQRQWTVTHDGTTIASRVWVRWHDLEGLNHAVTLRDLRTE